MKAAPPASATTASSGATSVHMAGYGRGRGRASPRAHTRTALTRWLHMVTHHCTGGPGLRATTGWLASGSSSEDQRARRDTTRLRRVADTAAAAGGRGHGRNLRFRAISPCDAADARREKNYRYATDYESNDQRLRRYATTIN